jgi:mRNA interferase RelE/StbE
MPEFKVIYINSARKQLDKLPTETRTKIFKVINSLSTNPRPHGYDQLSDFELQGLTYKALYRIRIGDYRAIYAIENEIVTITIVRIKHRKEVYKR